MIEVQGTRFNEAECEICPPGYTSPAGSSECTACARPPPSAPECSAARSLGVCVRARSLASQGGGGVWASTERGGWVAPAERR